MDCSKIKDEPVNDDDSEYDIDIEDEFALKIKREKRIEVKNGSSWNLDKCIERLSDDEKLKRSEKEKKDSNALEALSSNDLSSKSSEISDCSTFETSTNILTDVQRHKLQIIVSAKLHVEENISPEAKIFESRSKEILHNSIFIDSILKSCRDSYESTSSNDTIQQEELINFNHLIDQLFIHTAKVVLKRYKPSPSIHKPCSSGLEKQYKSCLAYCSSCKAPPRTNHINTCEKCNGSMTYRCHSCNFSTNIFSTANQHYYSKHVFEQDQIYYCLRCHNNYSSKKNLYKHHQKDHVIEGSVKKWQNRLQYYTASTSENNENYQCYKCEYASSNQIDIRNHIQANHDPMCKITDKPNKYSRKMEKVKNLLELCCRGCSRPRNLDQSKCGNCNISRLEYHCKCCPAKYSMRMEAIQHAKIKHLQNN